MSYAQGRSIDRAAQRRILDEVEALAAARGRVAVVVFDLDSTLYDNRPRQALILREYGALHDLAPLAATRPEHFESWSLVAAMRATGLAPALVERHQATAKQFWRERFFTSEYLVHDVPIAGAADFTRAIARTGAQVAYVTGRHIAMGPGSVACFRRDGLPLPDGERAHLLLKPHFGEDDDRWKLEAYARLESLGEVVAAFDNEPAHVNGYAARYPGARCVRLATDDSGRPIAVAPGVPSIADFTR